MINTAHQAVLMLYIVHRIRTVKITDCLKAKVSKIF